MATVSDLNNVPLSNLNYIDALLDKGPSWNFLTNANDTLLYSFSISTGTEPGQTGQVAFSPAQQSWTRVAIAQLQAITGIKFVETTDGTAAQIHFAGVDIADSSVTGLCSWNSNYGYNVQTNELTSYTANAWVYLDDKEWYGQNSNLTPGGQGYETLLHELGHAMGLKHPFEGSITLPTAQDNTSNTLMSYASVGGPYQTYSQYDIAALNWLYGGDGLGGTYGVNSVGGARYYTGTNGDDTFDGNAGNEFIDGAAGNNTVVFSGTRSSYSFSTLANGAMLVTGGNLKGSETLANIQNLTFSDGTFQRAQVTGDTTPPAAPTISVTKNANGYALGATPVVTGSAEAASTVKLYIGTTMVGSTVVDSTGLWSITTAALKDGMNYMLFATATDPSGNISPHSANVTFNVDATPPVIPTGTLTLIAGKNEVSYGGSGEAGTTIDLVNVNNATEVGRATVSADGYWHISSTVMPNGTYSVSVVSLDAADNATSSSSKMNFTINSPLNMTGDAGNNTFTSTADNNGIDGAGGMDTVVYGGARANFTVAKQAYGYSVVDNTGAFGRDTVVNVERLKFGDGKAVALDIDGDAGQVYRIYQAAFDRLPDPGGYAYWLNAMDKGMTLSQMSALVLANKEATDIYMADPSDQYFLTQLYHHVLHRDPDAAGLSYWLANVHSSTRADVMVMFSESPENQAQVIGSIQNGIDYTPWTGS
ncbi:hypothetical protein GCM10027321_15500 [Massilia terrae]|uniref:DUF4214 domain-containing protein n=1 Tax=Massilia terrae TaxID=1811224 RepID=A0ABT2D2C6_9BURK|nr:DUF4214 domain-containing protein [Massilia terrae]MCS0659931.1 DUF4214 domain-containing protein [Massilia terrae]